MLMRKKTGFAKWSYEDVPTKLWKIKKLSDMWGIGRRTAQSLQNMGIFTIYDLAHTDLALLEKRFGILGNQLYYHAWGIDYSKVEHRFYKGK